ncbi:hypothetical protein CMEL01_15178 [Colletotrichum melonis]|uniref:TAM domain methyltransferase n=1 Tax=Colletotrichum melonis TaxID=1209925 RepID=A0AAI9UPD3_9PEZI|nr:hypothetical protein CMEL01_15178 [Colletotrichum melonis]
MSQAQEVARAAPSPPKSSPKSSPNSPPNNADDATGTILPDEIGDDGESLVGPSVASSSTSVNSSILDYRIENGRTYHKYKDGKYAMPNDERELDRLDLTHNMFLLTFENKLGTAPPNADAQASAVHRVLDIGTGTGIWAIDFGDEHPEAEVLGVDLSAAWPSYTPPNVRFEIDDIEDTWTYSRPFDYIHSRVMTSSIKNWEDYTRTCFDNLNPGGYLELNEIDACPQSDDGTLKEDSAILKSVRMLEEAANLFGRPYHNAQALKEILTNIGFEDVTIQKYKWPTNPWAKDARHKELGAWCHENLVAGWEGFCMAPFTRALNWSREEVLILMMQVRKEFSDRSIHAYFPVSHSIYARKPAGPASA